MKYFAAGAVVLIVLLTPSITKSDFVPEDIVPTYESILSLQLELTVNGEGLVDGRAFDLQPGREYLAEYRVDPIASSTITDEQRLINEEVVAYAFDTYVPYVELWKGTPFNTTAELVKDWDIRGARNGSLTFTVPDQGEYFFAVTIPNVIHQDPLPMCDEGEYENCYQQNPLNAGTFEELRTYFQTVLGSFSSRWGLVQSYMQGIGVIRFAVPDDAPASGSPIIFLPGTTGSRLYQQVSGTEKKRWEPSLGTSQQDVRSLYFREDGKSANPLYTKADATVERFEISGLGYDVYQSFFAQLERMRTSGSIASFESFPYDWRESPITVVEEGTLYDDGRHYLADRVARLASSSPTGKVSIISHSNGGLVAKALMMKLEREGKSGLVDTVVLVGVPQLGTPETLSSMLHGDISPMTRLGGIFLTQRNARGFSEYLPGAATLLPSARYFERTADPILDLTEAPKLAGTSGIAGNTIRDGGQFNKFVTATNARPRPAFEDVETPNTLSHSVMGRAGTDHAALDNWSPPSGVRVVQVAGWGYPTTSGLAYSESESFSCTIGASCGVRSFYRHESRKSIQGDGTVMLASQVATPGIPTYYIDIPSSNVISGKNNRHGTMTEMEEFQALLPLLLSSTTIDVLPDRISYSIPVSAGDEEGVVLRVLSPVSLEVQDANGRSTGKLQGTSSEVALVREEIPNSYYEEYGEGKYIGVTGNIPLTAKLKGLDTGTFTFEVLPQVNGQRQVGLSFRDIPVTASTTAQLMIGPEAASSTLMMDIDGNGVIDISLGSSTPASDPIIYLEMVRQTVKSMSLGETTKRQLYARISNAQSLLKKSAEWDAADDEKIHFDQKKGEAVKARVGRKLDRTAIWVGIEVLKSKLWNVLKKNGPNPHQITEDQAIALVTMLMKAKSL